MLQVARLAPRVLGETAGLVSKFIGREQAIDGGFKNRAGQGDLYYTVFALDSLIALQAASESQPIPSAAAAEEDQAAPDEAGSPPKARLSQVPEFLGRFGAGEGLDFVHLCALARAWSVLSLLLPGTGAPIGFHDECRKRLDLFHAFDGGYANEAGAARGTVYGCFLAFGAYQDLGFSFPEPLGLVRCLKRLEVESGGWSNDSEIRIGSVPATAAAVTLLRNLRMPVNSAVGDWLLKQLHPQGGFCAVPGAPVPDLLSTATALHALSGMEIAIEPHREACLDFVDSLWTNEGSFHGHWEEEILDCEYTFYGLLALGHLSV